MDRKALPAGYRVLDTICFIQQFGHHSKGPTPRPVQFFGLAPWDRWAMKPDKVSFLKRFSMYLSVIYILLPIQSMAHLVTNTLIGRFKIVAESGGIFRHCHWFRPWRSIHDVDRHSGLSPEHQVKWSVSGGGMDAGVICHAQSSQVVFPLKWLFRDRSSQHREECSITPLH